MDKSAALAKMIAAAQWLLDDLGDAGETHSPDGVEYDSVRSMREALEAAKSAEA